MQWYSYNSKLPFRNITHSILIITLPVLIPLFALYSQSFLDISVKEVHAQTIVSPSGFKTFYDSNNGIKIQYPNEWTNFDQSFLDMFSKPNVTIVAGFKPPDSSVAVVVSIEPQSKNQSRWKKNIGIQFRI